MYTIVNFRTKKALKEAVARRLAFLESNSELAYEPPVEYYQPGPFGGNEPRDGTFCCEGPHYPEPHQWYAGCTAVDGEIVKVK